MKPRALSGDTIAAIATPIGEGGIGIVRLSGPEALRIAGNIFEPSQKTKGEQKSFTVRHGHVVAREGKAAKKVDEALLTVMRAPKSYTGEDTAEISAHGGWAVMQEVLRLAVESGARLAEPGEFTKRAFLNGRMDLLQAEAVLDLIEAKSAQSLRWASSQLEGAFSQKIKEIRAVLVEVLSHLEADGDFPDDFPDADPPAVLQKKIGSCRSELEALIQSSRLGFLAKRGLKLALWGRPNVGKSSLMNQLAESPRAIVTPQPGTTRDMVEEEIAIEGFPVRLQDTAGVQESQDPIEKEGVERSRKAMREADLVLFVLDSSQAPQPADKELFEACREKPFIAVLNKSDLAPRTTPETLRAMGLSAPAVLCSCLGLPGVEDLKKEILSFITQGSGGIPDEAVVSTVRQREALQAASEDLSRAHKASSEGLSGEFVASDIRHALDHLGMLVGEIVTDDILEAVFSRFCIGK